MFEAILDFFCWVWENFGVMGAYVFFVLLGVWCCGYVYWRMLRHYAEELKYALGCERCSVSMRLLRGWTGGFMPRYGGPMEAAALLEAAGVLARLDGMWHWGVFWPVKRLFLARLEGMYPGLSELRDDEVLEVLRDFARMG